MENMHNDVRVLRVNYFFLIECFSIGCRTTKITVITTAANESSNFEARQNAANQAQPASVLVLNLIG